MRIGTTMLIGAIMALVAGIIYRRNGATNWSRLMQRIRWNRLATMFMGRRFIRRLWFS